MKHTNRTPHGALPHTEHGWNWNRNASALPLLVSLLTAVSLLSTPEAKAAGTDVPRVVVSILVDQLRTDYLNAFMPLYGQEGFVRLLKEGRVYSQGEYPHNRPDRAAAAATLVTGTTPYNHGIVAQRWLNRETLRPTFCVDDQRYPGLQTADASAPTYLGVSTVGDELKIATDGKSLVYAIAPYRDAAVLTAGHAADGAVWIDNTTGQWCTTSYYEVFPTWASVLNNNSLSERLKQLTWRPTNELVGNFSYFVSGGTKKPFAHKFKGDKRFFSYKTSGLVNGEIATAAAQCLNGTTMGADNVPDYLALTFYAGNLDHKTITECPTELQDTYVRLDQALADVIRAVEHKVGRGNALFVLTSTGYTDEEAVELEKYRVPTGTFNVERAAALLNLYFVALYGQGQFVESTFGTQLYLNHKLIEQKQLNLSDLLQRAQDFLLQLAGVKDVYTSARLQQGAWTPGISRMLGAYNPRYSGDITVEVTPGWHFVNNTTRENKLIRESYIQFPIIFLGTGFKAETVREPVTVDYVAPTLSKAMRIRAPNGCSLPPLFCGD